MTKDEVLKLALDALEKTNRFVWYGTHSEPIGQIAEQGNTAIAAIKEALTQPEPFAPDWVNYRQGKIDGAQDRSEWVGLDAEDLDEIDSDALLANCSGDHAAMAIVVAVMVEAKLKEKNT